MSAIRFRSFPSTEPPPEFIEAVVGCFRQSEERISTTTLKKGLTSNEVLARLATGLAALGFDVEKSKKRAARISRPVFFGENGTPTLRYEIDAYHAEWRCGLEVEAGRATMGNAIYRDLVQGMVMVGVDHLIIAVPMAYKYKSSGRNTVSSDYKNAVAIAETLYAQHRVRMPYGLTLIGY